MTKQFGQNKEKKMEHTQVITLRVIKLGTVCTDKATKLKGTVTHWLCNMGKRIDYLFQPEGLNPEDGQPVKKIILEEERLGVSPEYFEEVEIPFEILGTHVTSKASGFSGMAVEFVRHINGCFHVVIQPSGVLNKTNSPVLKTDFDLRECTGDMITKMDEEQLKTSKENTPSPTGDTFDKCVPHTNSMNYQ